MLSFSCYRTPTQRLTRFYQKSEEIAHSLDPFRGRTVARRGSDGARNADVSRNYCGFLYSPWESSLRGYRGRCCSDGQIEDDRTAKLVRCEGQGPIQDIG